MDVTACHAASRRTRILNKLPFDAHQISQQVYHQALLCLSDRLYTNDLMSVSQDPEEERPETPLALDTALSSSAETATTLQSPSTTSAASSSSHQFVLPIPTPSTNRSRASFSLPDQNDEAAVWSLDSLPPEIKKADVSIARA